jgi:Fe-S cluster biogenesis protein NfuA
MFIQIEETPNPSTLKFIPEQEVLSNRVMQINNIEQAEISPLAKNIFHIAGVKSVFLGGDFLSVTKEKEVSWDIIKSSILDVILDHYVSGRPMLNEEKTTQKQTSPVEDSELVTQIKELLDERIRPAVAQDGGDIIFHSFENGVVKLEMHGACAGCPSSTQTLKNGIENMLKYYVPEVESVEAVE